MIRNSEMSRYRTPKSWCVVYLLLVLQCAAVAANVNASQPLCSAVRYAYKAKGFSDKDIPMQPIPGSDLRFCPEGLSCCTQSMEDKLSQAARQQYDLLVRQATTTLHNTFTSRAKKFDDFFRELLDKSKRDFHEMFKRTYGILYEQNSVVFTDLFRDLEDYYGKGRVDLEEAMDHFFSTLYQRMFTVLNAQYRFDDKYLLCVSTHMKELKPFGDVPKKLSIQVKRSFVATRTFAQALAVARDVVTKIQTVGSTSDCSRDVSRMSLCPACGGFPQLKPCANLCLGVLSRCLASHVQLNTEWDNYIEALVKVADRLVGPFNIEQVVDPIDIKISDAIMNFQENGLEVTQKVFKGCGQPRLGKRSTAPQQPARRLDQSPRSPAHVGVSSAPGHSLERLAREIKQKVRSTKSFWSNLPQTVCSDRTMTEQTNLQADCWNGTHRTKSSSDLSADGETVRTSSLVNEQIFSLRLITNKLENAYNGMDVEWDDEWSSTSGSGSGSGDGSDASDDDDDDDEDGDRHRHRGPDTAVPNTTQQKNQIDDEDIVFYGTNHKPDTTDTTPKESSATPIGPLKTVYSILLVVLLFPVFYSNY